MRIAVFIFLFTALVCNDAISNDLKYNLEISQGFFSPSDPLYEDIYGTTFPTFVGQSVQWNEKLKLTAGLRYSRKQGRTVLSGDISPNNLTFTTISIPLSVSYHFRIHNLRPFLSAGVNYNIFKEVWDEIPVNNTRRKFGYEIGGGVLLHSFSKFGLSTGAYYSAVSPNHLDIKGWNPFLQLSYSWR